MVILNTTEEIRREHQIIQSRYAQKPIKGGIETTGRLVEGSFYQNNKPMTVKTMITRRINKSLCGFLMITIAITFVSYYIAMTYEAKLNNLDNEIVRINTENQDLQAELDRFKSFNNVDDRISKFNLLQKADKVIEVTALNTNETPKTEKKVPHNGFNWVIGY